MSASGESSPDRTAHPGSVALGLLAGKWTVAIIRELRGAPLRTVELERRMPTVAHATVSERLAQLVRHGIVERRDDRGGGRRGRHALGPRGHELEELLDAAAAIELEIGQALESDGGGDSDRRAPGEWVVSALADPHVRTIRRALVDGPLSLAEIERSQPGVAHATLSRRAAWLAQVGLLSVTGRHGERRHALVDANRRLARVVLMASLCEARWAQPDTRVPFDLRGSMHMIAPLARLPSGLVGACRLAVSGDPGEPPIEMSLRRGKLRAHAIALTVPIDARGRASAVEWADALLRGEASTIEVEGDAALLRAVVVALAESIVLRT